MSIEPSPHKCTRCGTSWATWACRISLDLAADEKLLQLLRDATGNSTISGVCRLCGGACTPVGDPSVVEESTGDVTILSTTHATEIADGLSWADLRTPEGTWHRNEEVDTMLRSHEALRSHVLQLRSRILAAVTAAHNIANPYIVQGKTDTSEYPEMSLAGVKDVLEEVLGPLDAVIEPSPTLPAVLPALVEAFQLLSACLPELSTAEGYPSHRGDVEEWLERNQYLTSGAS